MTECSGRLITLKEIEAAGQLDQLVAEMRDGFSSRIYETIEAPQRTLILRQQPFAAFGTMTAFSPSHALFLSKTAAFVEPVGVSQNVRSVNALVVAISSTTGELIATLDGIGVTNLKCATLAALVTDRCARVDSRVLGLVGSGEQAWQQLRGILAVRKVATVRVFSRSSSNVVQFVGRARRQWPEVQFVAAASGEAAVAEADIVSTATTSRTPVFAGSVPLPRHVHISCVGAHTRDSREVPRQILAMSTLIVEDRQTAIAEAGPLHEEAREIHELFVEPAVSLEDQPTVFSSTGYARFDLLTVAHVLGRLDRNAVDGK